MPQMAPMLWLILFFYFISLFVLFIVGIYYTKLLKGSGDLFSNESRVNTESYSWEW